LKIKPRKINQRSFKKWTDKAILANVKCIKANGLARVAVPKSPNCLFSQMATDRFIVGIATSRKDAADQQDKDTKNKSKCPA